MSSYLVVAHKANLAAARLAIRPELLEEANAFLEEHAEDFAQLAKAEETEESPRVRPKQARRRARTAAGAFVADDPTTPENEAWEVAG